jgi:hypothetical protein
MATRPAAVQKPLRPIREAADASGTVWRAAREVARGGEAPLGLLGQALPDDRDERREEAPVQAAQRLGFAFDDGGEPSAASCPS